MLWVSNQRSERRSRRLLGKEKEKGACGGKRGERERSLRGGLIEYRGRERHHTWTGIYHCKNKLVVLATEWLSWLQTSWRDSGLFANCGSFPDCHWSCIFERGHTCMYQTTCNNSHSLADIVTTEHLRENHHKNIIFRNAVLVTLTNVLRVVSCKVWFGLKLLMQLTSNTKINLTTSAPATRETAQWLKQPIFFCSTLKVPSHHRLLNWVTLPLLVDTRSGAHDHNYGQYI